MKNRGKTVHTAFGCASHGCLVRVLHGDMANAKAPPLNASCLSARAQKNRGLQKTAGLTA